MKPLSRAVRAACEALATRCPVVSTRVGGAVEALRDRETALLVEPDSPTDLATAIEELLDDGELAEQLAKAGAAVEWRFAPAVGEGTFGEAVQTALTARAARSKQGGIRAVPFPYPSAGGDRL